MAEIGAMDIKVRDVLALRVGDIIRLDSVRVNDPMTVRISDRRKFLCRPGVLGNKMAVQVIKKLEDIDQADFEELTTSGEEEL
jgi:flagellar motor switch protein FliM